MVIGNIMNELVSDIKILELETLKNLKNSKSAFNNSIVFKKFATI